ncbi:conserved hypothetical protein [Lodderomyces elongisporus NRRL YB-4239]|uniref:DNA mismatch repair protein MSH3 n=1 Tax=Lodderomyces elongisporus (strain ATCC 11503 / CBS 2605 / JCM 1781 / NBRC 1676 / NRRL YB-4239) TaxID=379508 RepID=MSH3_LODEL|nr:RecName: Full=DNA mismatch repair protein MSH3; AltName: Full=MutS protein homolog 3 [Lodderomyces elongisporus NRRL YB-4239]EDK44366.1 conserved hypothetical protein [Lodderomyces elongisporus NRRL YB-4239]
MASKKQSTISLFFSSQTRKSPGRDAKKNDISSSPFNAASSTNNSIGSTPRVSPIAKFQYNKSTSTLHENTNPRVKRVSTLNVDVEKEHKKIKRARSTKLTPLESQILQLLSEHPDKILLIQVGYKYKVYGEDARHVARCLNIMFISSSTDPTFSYCSFPENRLHINLQRILNTGVKVGVVKQMESAIIKEVDKIGKSGDLMKRELTGVYTRGTYMNDEFIDSGVNSPEQEELGYIVCVNEISRYQFAIVAIQPLTGEIIYDDFTDDVSHDELETRLLYLRPSEVLLLGCGGNESNNNNNNNSNNSSNNNDNGTDADAQNQTSTLQCFQKLVNHNIKIERKPKGLNNLKAVLNAAALNFYRELLEPVQVCVSELVKYLEEFNLSNIFTVIENVSKFDSKKTMILPASTMLSLEIFQNSENSTTKGTLFSLLNHTKTPFGMRLLESWVSHPLIDKDKIEERYQAVEDLSTGSHFNDCLSRLLQKIGKNLDLESIAIKIHYSTTTRSLATKINRKDIFMMLLMYQSALQFVSQFEKTIKASNLSPLLKRVLDNLLQLANTDTVDRFMDMINPSYLLGEQQNLHQSSRSTREQKVKFFNLNNGFEEINRELAEIMNVKMLLEEELVKVKKLLQRPQLNYVTSNGEPYLIEVRNGKAVESLPIDFIKINGTTTVSRFRSKEIAHLYKMKQYHEEVLNNRCDEAFNTFLNELDSHYGFFQGITKNLAVLDCLLSLAAVSNSNSNTHVKPNLSDELIIDVKNARHPIIEHLRDGYVANDIDIRYDSNRVLVITGPNMGGKSSYVKMVALLIIMTQIGCYIPCEAATIGIFDSILIRMGASDNLLKGRSTFMTEMLECSNIIQKLTPRSLVILDEIGRGTGSIDGYSLAYAILRYLVESKLKPIVLCITHYTGLLSETEDEKFDKDAKDENLDTGDDVVKSYYMGYEEITQPGQVFPEIVFLYNLCPGVSNSYGLQVAKMAGLPKKVLLEAYLMSSVTDFD